MSDAESGPALFLTVTHKSQIADDIFMFELRDAGGRELPPFDPGAHLTVTTPAGSKRRYSLCEAPTDRQRYVIAVKREHNGRGGSLSFITDVNEGDQVAADPPVNDFPMSQKAPTSYLFIAGGIGITPIRAMIRSLLADGKDNFALYYFSRTAEAAAFREEFSDASLSAKVVVHHDNGKADEAYDLWPVLEEERSRHLYCCGPKALMEAVRDMTGHWSDSAVHFEDFVGASARRVDDTAFFVTLAKSNRRIEVPAGVSILDALRKIGHALPSSCESGTCGTCRMRYLEGEPDHRDLVLSDKEKRSELMVCVSRALSSDLTLDL
jgi:phthalate 4,5-dioxygenase reductase subunit